MARDYSRLIKGGSADKTKEMMRDHAARPSVHSDDAYLHNAMPMRPTQLPPDANSEMNYAGEGEDLDDGDEDQVD